MDARSELVPIDVWIAYQRERQQSRPTQGPVVKADLHARLLEAFLTTSGLLDNLDSGARARMVPRFCSRTLGEGELLVSPGEVPLCMGLVLSGKMAVERWPRTNSDDPMMEIRAGEYFVFAGAVTGVPSRVRMYALSETRLLFLSQSELTGLIREYPGLRAMASRIRGHARVVDRDVFAGAAGLLVG